MFTPWSRRITGSQDYRITGSQGRRVKIRVRLKVSLRVHIQVTLLTPVVTRPVSCQGLLPEILPRLIHHASTMRTQGIVYEEVLHYSVYNRS